MQAHKPGASAVAAVPPGPVGAVRSVQAGAAGALVHVRLAEGAEEAGRAGAGEGGRRVAAGGAVLARPRLAFVHLQLAADACVPKWTNAVIPPYKVETRCPVQAWV